MNDFWETDFMKRVRIKTSGKTGRIIDMGSIPGSYIVEVDSPDNGDVYPLRDCRKEDLVFEPISKAVAI